MPRHVVSLERERNARCECQHVRPHRLELFVGHGDDLDLELAQELDETDGQQRQIRDDEVVVQRTEQRQQVEDDLRTVEMWQVERQDLDFRERALECVRGV